jgi:hypothetical protein
MCKFCVTLVHFTQDVLGLAKLKILGNKLKRKRRGKYNQVRVGTTWIHLSCAIMTALALPRPRQVDARTSMMSHARS